MSRDSKQQTIGPDRDVRCVMADPPWSLESGGGQSKRGADRHYELLTPEETVEVIQRDCPEWDRIADDAHLWLWCTNATLSKSSRAAQDGISDARYVAEGLGFEPTTVFTWVKVSLAGVGESWIDDLRKAYFDGSDPSGALGEALHKGLGQYSYGSTEHLLFCTRGEFMKPDPSDRWPTAFFAPVGEHSEKPDVGYEIAEDVSPGERLELFARREREGWTCWGEEV